MEDGGGDPGERITPKVYLRARHLAVLAPHQAQLVIAEVGVPGVLEQKTSILCDPLDLLIYIGPIPIISTLAKQTAGDVDENLFHGLNSTIIVEKIKCFGPRWT
jgi:hypothetical protein